MSAFHPKLPSAFDPLRALVAAARPCYAAQSMEGGSLTYFSKGIAQTQLKRDYKARLLASIRADLRTPSHGMTKDQAIVILSQDIADYDEILGRLRGHDGA